MESEDDLDDEGEWFSNGDPCAPRSIILPAQDIIFAFRSETDYGVNFQDMAEIIIEIFQVLVNQPMHNVGLLNTLPQVDRMIDNRFRSDEAFYDKVKAATARMGYALQQRVKDHKGYFNGQFPYIFDRFVQWDLILTLLPY
jgi:hypothetical protein